MNEIMWGMPTLIELKDIEDNVKLCHSLGLSFVELNMNLPEYQPNRMDLEKLLHLKEKYNIIYTIHLPEEFDIANFNDDISTAYVKIFTDTVGIALKLNSPVINMHMNMGVHFKLPTEKINLYQKYFNEYLNKIAWFADYADDLLKATDTKLCIENTGIYDFDYIKMAVDTLIERDNIFLTWDMGHDHASGNKDKAYIMTNIDKLRHMHFHDAIGEKNHLPLFTGEIDIYDKINLAKEHGCKCVIETKSVEGLKESVNGLDARGLL